MNASTTQSIIDVVSKAFAPVAEKIGQGAQFGWQVVITQQYVVAAQDFIGTFFCLVAIIVCIKLIPKMVKWNERGDWEMGIVLAVGAIIGCTVLSLFAVIDAVSHAINPAYYAIQFFLSLGGVNTN